MLKGFTAPRSPLGAAGMVPSPSWHFAGDVLAVEFWNDADLSKLQCRYGEAFSPSASPRGSPRPPPRAAETLRWGDIPAIGEESRWARIPPNGGVQERFLEVHAW